MRNRFELTNEGVISSDEIRQILEKYRIGKKPLAKLLGWGETTIIRYMEGDTPTSEYSMKLKRILDSPEFYYDILIKRQKCLTNVAFRKSKNAVISKIMSSKIYAATYYIINKSDGEICPSYIQYLLYYIQAFSLALYDKEMFQEEYGINNEKMPYLKLYKNMKRCGIHILEMGEDYLSDQEKQLIDATQEAFSWYGPKAFSTMMNMEKSMLKSSRDKYNYRIVSKEAIMVHFKKICKDYGIEGIEDINKYPDKCIYDVRNMGM